MTLLAKAGFLNTTTNAAGNTVVVSGLWGENTAPKIVLFWWTGRTDTSDARGRADHKGGFGYAISTSDRRFIASLAQDTPTTMVTNRMQGNAQCIGITTTADAVDGLMDVQSMDSASGGGFTLVIDDAFSASFTIQYLALGGDDIVNVFGGNFTSNTVTGNQSVNGLTALPNFIIYFTTGQTTIDNTVAVDSQLCIGAAKSSSNRYVVSGVGDDGIGTSRARSYAIDSEIIALSASTPNSGIEDRADFVDFHTSPSNGFTINWTEKVATAKIVNYIAFNFSDAAMVVLGDLLTQTDTTTDITESGLGITPIGGMFLSHMLAKSTADTYQNDHLLSIGAFNSASSRLASSIADDDAAGTAVVSTGVEFDEVYLNLAPTGTITGLMDVKSVDQTGFTNIMDDADPSQAFVFYFVIGYILLNGTLSKTLDDVTASAAGVVAIKGDAAITLDAVTLSAAGTVTGAGSGVNGDAAITLDAVTASAAGTVLIQGASAVNLDALTSSATGVVPIVGSANIQLGDVTVSGAGILAISGQAAINLDALTANAQGSVAIKGQAAITLDALTLIADNGVNTGVPATQAIIIVQPAPITLHYVSPPVLVYDVSVEPIAVQPAPTTRLQLAIEPVVVELD